MSVVGAHRVSGSRAYVVARLQGLVAIAWTVAFAGAILLTGGRIIGTPAWYPLTQYWTLGYVVIAVPFLLAGVLGIIGLVCDDDDAHRWPRIMSLLSAALGMLWCGVVLVAFVFAWITDWPNAGPFLAFPGAVLHFSRLVLLWEFDK